LLYQFATPMKTIPLAALVLLTLPGAAPALDTNSNQQSDVWEAVHGVSGLAPGVDSDGDGATNREESIAGTNPLSAASAARIRLVFTNGQVRAQWTPVPGKQYRVEGAANPGGAPYTPVSPQASGFSEFTLPASTNAVRFLRLSVADANSDADTLTDAEELALGLNPLSAHSERYEETDDDRVSAAWNAASVVSVAILDGEIREDWPEGAVLAIRRTGGLKPITVGFTLGGTATAGADYTADAGASVQIPAGAREAWVTLTPVADAAVEAAETIVLTLQTGAGYSLAAPTAQTVTLQPSASTPGAKEAARFLIQASFGPDADDPADADLTPENVEDLMTRGFAGWLDDQFTRPLGLHQPFIPWLDAQEGVYWNPKQTAWWNRAMGVPSLVPGGSAQLPDPLRQRMAYALSQILVISDRPEALGVEPEGMANYYDLLVTHAFGNYRTLLFEVSRHPCMGFYLSHVKNRPPDPVNNIHPDENFAREIMQLFTIGLWELNLDGTRKRTPQGQFIPTYGNPQITELARVFTGFSYDQPGVDFFEPAYNYFLLPMQMWDEYHDLNPKTLVGGVTLPARVASANPDRGTAGLADVNAAIDALFNHPNVGPFIGRQLIQRFVTSNPSTNYVARVAAVFNNNGSSVRGDLKATLRAILLDPEARGAAYREQPGFGKLREPFLRAVNLARATNASAPVGAYPISNLDDLLAQEPCHAPSVFNYYLPGYSPPGPVLEAGLVAPEFQILTSATAISTPNYFWTAITGDFNRWGAASNNEAVRCNITHELTLATNVDLLLRRLDLALTGGVLSPREFQAIRESLLRIDAGVDAEWQRARVEFALYMIVNSPDFAVLR
jgi:uncharacterized protein (DUF1800 family)